MTAETRTFAHHIADFAPACVNSNLNQFLEKLRSGGWTILSKTYVPTRIDAWDCSAIIVFVDCTRPADQEASHDR